MKNVNKQAAKDAFEYASSQMAYGEGAGIRRRHIETAVNYKADRIPGYAAAFNAAVEQVDMTKAVSSAQRSGKARDVGAVTGKNIRAIARGDKSGMSTPVIIAVVALGIAHKTGHDKKAWEYSKRKTNDVRAWVKRKL